MISVISTNRNCARSLLPHLESVWNAMGDRDFEYVTVDGDSGDGSFEIMKKWRQHHGNMHVFKGACTRGGGRDFAAKNARGNALLVVDTDTIYEPWLGKFAEVACDRFKDLAVQAIFAGVYPRDLWLGVGGQKPIDVAEDFDLWMRLHELGLIRFYPAVTGKNTLQRADASDFLGERFLTRRQRIERIWRRELRNWRMRNNSSRDVTDIWKMNTVNLGFAPLENRWFGECSAHSMPRRLACAVRRSLEIVT